MKLGVEALGWRRKIILLRVAYEIHRESWGHIVLRNTTWWLEFGGQANNEKKQCYLWLRNCMNYVNLDIETK